MQQRVDRSPDDVPAMALTAIQREVVILIVEGLSNQAIADRLDLARATVSQHIATILWRLGLSNRSDVVRWALRQGCGTHHWPAAAASS